MVEAPRIRIIYEKIKFTENTIILDAGGATYRKIGLNLIGYQIKKWWYAGKYLYTLLRKKNSKYVIRTHMMMYGRIIINDEVKVNPKLIPFLILDLSDSTNLTWYLSSIKILDPNCTTDLVHSNYYKCSSRETIQHSLIMTKLDLSNPDFNLKLFEKNLKIGIQEYPNEIITDFLLDQAYFPGIGNILQQEALYRCCILPTNLVSELSLNDFYCLIKKLRKIINLLYQSYLGEHNNKMFKIYHKKYCPKGHKTITKYIGKRHRRTTWCPICQV